MIGRHRQRPCFGKGQEIDLIGGASGELWVCQSKWVTTNPVGPEVLDELLAQAEPINAEFNPSLMRLWLFAYQGLTKNAAEIAKQQGMFWSTKAELNEVLRASACANCRNLILRIADNITSSDCPIWPGQSNRTNLPARAPEAETSGYISPKPQFDQYFYPKTSAFRSPSAN